MESVKPHAVLIPLPAQGHINPLLKLAKLLHFKGFHITFVHTEFNYHRLVNSRGADSLVGLKDFQFETIPDGLPPTNQRGILDLAALCTSLSVDGLRSFRDVILKLNASSDLPPVSCIVADGAMSFTIEVAEEFGIPEMMFFTHSGCGLLGYLHFEELVERGYFPLKEESYMSNGFLDTTIDWIPSMDGIRLKDLPTFLRTTNSNDVMFNYNIKLMKNARRAKGVILNTFDDLEQDVLEAIKTKFPQLYTIGPLSTLHQHVITETSNNYLNSIESNLWKEELECLDWLDKRESKSVLYVNYGSMIIMTPKQLNEFAMGLANSNCPFLWIIRPGLLDDATEVMPKKFMEVIDGGKGLVLGWCPQEKVLGHPSIGGFLTHCGWNSSMESICEGVPLICWPFFADQQTNCFFACKKWEIGLEIDEEVSREMIEIVVRELMDGDLKGKDVRKKAMEWKIKAETAINQDGSSYVNFDRLIKQLKQQ